MADETERCYPERIAIALCRLVQGYDDYFVLDPTAPREAKKEYVRADICDAERQRAEKAEAELERLRGS